MKIQLYKIEMHWFLSKHKRLRLFNFSDFDKESGFCLVSKL